jgi:hypothetical protein
VFYTPRAAPAGAGFFLLLSESRLGLHLFLSALARTALWCAAWSVTTPRPTNPKPAPGYCVRYYGNLRPPLLRLIISINPDFFCEKELKTAEKSLEYNNEHMPKIWDRERRKQ